MATDPGALKVIVDSVARLVARGPRGFPGKDGMAPGDLKFGVWLVQPEGYLYCDHGLHLKTSEPALYAAIGDQFTLPGDDPLYFRVPDYRERPPVGASGFGPALTNDGLAFEDRDEAWSHAHSHTASTSISGGITAAGTGAALTGGIAAANTDHNHTGPADHGTGAVTASGAGTRLTTPGHGSTGLAAQAPGQSHAHGHNFGISDPGHSHGHNISASTSTGSVAANPHPKQYCHVLIKT